MDFFFESPLTALALYELFGIDRIALDMGWSNVHRLEFTQTEITHEDYTLKNSLEFCRSFEPHFQASKVQNMFSAWCKCPEYL